MRFILNSKEVVIPSSLSEITLGQRVDFHEKYGRELDEMAQSILEMEEGIDKQLEITEFQFEKMFRTMAFFAGTTPEALKESDFIDDIGRIYYASLATLFDDETQVEIKQTYHWKGETWCLHPPKLENGSKMKVGEFIDAKQMIKNMIDVGKGRWEYMIPLCAVYLRKQGEEYDKSFMYEGSDRQLLMRELPMDIALGVGFFLTSSMNSFLNSLGSSKSPELNPPVHRAASTSTVGAGSTSSRRSRKQKSSISQART